MSVDSVDYTSMIAGDVDEEVAEKVRKTRREKKHNKLCGCGGGLTRSNYRAILKNSAPVSEAMKKEKEVPAVPLVPTAPAVPAAPAVSAVPAVPAVPAPVSEKKSEKKKSERKVNEKKMNEKKPKKTEEDGWVTIEKKH